MWLLVALALPPAEQLVLFAATPAQTGAETATGPVAEFSWVPPVAVAPPVDPDPGCVVLAPLAAPQVVLLAATPAQTGAETATGPVTVCESLPLVAVVEPDVWQFVLFAATPAQTGADTATGPVTLVDPAFVCEVPAPLPLLVPQVVLLATTPAQTGADTATGPVTLFELGLDPELAVELELLPAPQFVLFEATPAQTGAETATGPVALELPVDSVFPAVETPALTLGDDAPTLTLVVAAEPDGAPLTTTVLP